MERTSGSMAEYVPVEGFIAMVEAVKEIRRRGWVSGKGLAWCATNPFEIL